MRRVVRFDCFLRNETHYCFSEHVLTIHKCSVFVYSRSLGNPYTDLPNHTVNVFMFRISQIGLKFLLDLTGPSSFSRKRISYHIFDGCYSLPLLGEFRPETQLMLSDVVVFVNN